MRASWSTAAAAWLVVACGLAASARAQVNVGDPVAFQFTTINGEQFTSKDLEGKLVIVEHWATWCGPCRAVIPHLKEMHAQYAPKGVALIGVSHDRAAADVKPFLEQNGMTWPQVMQADARGVNWGVRGIPHAFIISPQGKLLWRGHPGSMDQALEQAIREHPPRPRRDPRAEAMCDKPLPELVRAAHAALGASDFAGLAATLEAVKPEDLREPQHQRVLDTLARRLASFDDADGQLAAAFDGRTEAKARLDAIRALAAGGGADAAAGSVSATLLSSRLAKAQKLADDGKHVDAYRGFRWVAQRGGDSNEAATANARVEAYEQDAAFMTELRRVEATEQARALLGMADGYAQAGNKAEAVQAYEQVVQRYPDTPEAQQASDALRRLR